MASDPSELTSGRATLELLLQRSPQALSCLLDAAAGLVLLLNRRGEVLFFSPGCESITGWSASDVLGHPVWEFLWTEEEVEASSLGGRVKADDPRAIELLIDLYAPPLAP